MYNGYSQTLMFLQHRKCYVIWKEERIDGMDDFVGCVKFSF